MSKKRVQPEGRPQRLEAIVDNLEQLTAALEEEGFCWAPAELQNITNELREHVVSIRSREPVT